MKRLTTLFLLLLSIELKTETTYPLLVDLNFSPYASSPDFIFLQYSFTNLEENIVNPNIKPDREWMTKFGRFADLLFIWYPINEAIMVTQHEVFGHGYRIRDIGSSDAKVNSYKIGMPFPYGTGGGSTNFSISENLSTRQKIAIDIGGVESTAILACRLKLHWLQNQQLPAKAATLYLSSQHDLTGYIFGTTNEDGDDIHNYINNLNISYPDDPITLSNLRDSVMVNFLDPVTYYAAFGLIRYIFTGLDGDIPMWNMRGVKYLPSFRLGLTPNGPEFFFENFFVVNEQPIYAYAKYGSHASNDYWGLGYEQQEVYRWQCLTFGGRIDLWGQPKAVSPFGFVQNEDNARMGINNQFTYSYLLGAAVSVIAKQELIGSPLALYEQIGYKTKGFLPGESLDNSLILRLGFTVRF